MLHHDSAACNIVCNVIQVIQRPLDVALHLLARVASPAAIGQPAAATAAVITQCTAQRALAQAVTSLTNALSSLKGSAAKVPCGVFSSRLSTAQELVQGQAGQVLTAFCVQQVPDKDRAPKAVCGRRAKSVHETAETYRMFMACQRQAVAAIDSLCPQQPGRPSKSRGLAARGSLRAAGLQHAAHSLAATSQQAPQDAVAAPGSLDLPPHFGLPAEPLATGIVHTDSVPPAEPLRLSSLHQTQPMLLRLRLAWANRCLLRPHDWGMALLQSRHSPFQHTHSRAGCTALEHIH